MDPIEGFGDIGKYENNLKEGKCYLKTKSYCYKEFFTQLIGNDLYFYKKKGDSDHKIMHSLKGTFIEIKPVELDIRENQMWPVKIMIPPVKSRVIYFDTEAEQKEWARYIQNIVGN